MSSQGYCGFLGIFFFFLVSICLLNSKSDFLKSHWPYVFCHYMQYVHPSKVSLFLQGIGWTPEGKSEVWVNLKRPFTLPEAERLVGQWDFEYTPHSHTHSGQQLHLYCNIPLLHNLPCWLWVQSDMPGKKLQQTGHQKASSKLLTKEPNIPASWFTMRSYTQPCSFYVTSARLWHFA